MKPVIENDIIYCEDCHVELKVIKTCNCDDCNIICCGKPMKVREIKEKGCCCS